ncbi:MAG: hypothetical protein ACI94Y_002210, partial [Maribacter sp.]
FYAKKYIYLKTKRTIGSLTIFAFPSNVALAHCVIYYSKTMG